MAQSIIQQGHLTRKLPDYLCKLITCHWPMCLSPTVASPELSANHNVSHLWARHARRSGQAPSPPCLPSPNALSASSPGPHSQPARFGSAQSCSDHQLSSPTPSIHYGAQFTVFRAMWPTVTASPEQQPWATAVFPAKLTFKAHTDTGQEPMGMAPRERKPTSRGGNSDFLLKT